MRDTEFQLFLISRFSRKSHSVHIKYEMPLLMVYTILYIPNTNNVYFVKIERSIRTKYYYDKHIGSYLIVINLVF